jgi:hypothetical protein
MAINIPIVSTFDPKGLNAAEKALGGLSGSAGKVGKILKASVVPGLIAAAGSVLAFTKGLNPAIQAASDLGENTSKIGVIFGDAGKAVTDFAKTAAREIGQSQNQVLAAAGTFGTFGKAAGLAGDQLATFTTDFITLSADLASFNNSTPDEAINAIGAALRGEAEPLRRFGVLLNDATLKAAAMELGIYSGSGALTAQQKILAAQKVIYEQTGDAQGDFARTSDGLANQQRILSAQLENIKIKIGEALLPAFTKLVKYVNDFVVPALDKFITSLTGGKGVSESIAQAISAFGPFGPSIVAGMRQAVGAMLQFVRTAAITYESIKAVTTAAKFFKGNVVGALKDFALVVGAAGIAQVTRKLEQDSNEFFDGLLNRVEGITSAIANQNKAITDAESRYEGWGKKIAGVTTDLDDLASDENKKGSGKGAVNKVTEAVKNASAALNKEMGDALDAAKDRLKKAQDAFNDFATSVSDVVKGALDFGAAFEEGGEDAGLTFFSALQKQADKAKEFADLVEQLLATGLSQEALQQVIDAGIDSGAAIAKELLKSGENVLRANKLVDETNRIAEQIGILSANKFYAAGVSNAQQYLAGVEAAMAVAQARLGKKGINLADIKGISSGFNNAISTTPTMTAPTMPSVIPVGAPTDKGQPSGNVTINVNSQLATKGEVGEAINDALRAYNRLSGPLQLQIA